MGQGRTSLKLASDATVICTDSDVVDEADAFLHRNSNGVKVLHFNIAQAKCYDCLNIF
jgi:hypothetical protein